MAEAAYFRDWRAAHPEYRTRESRRVADRRRRLGREDRSVEFANVRARRAPTLDQEPLPTLHRGHPLFDQARAIVGPDRSGLTILRDPLYDDLISVATLAILQGRDAGEDVRWFRSSELAWRQMTCQLHEHLGSVRVAA
jgi:hypothetical protein